MVVVMPIHHRLRLEDRSYHPHQVPLGLLPIHSCELEVSNRSALLASENKTLGLYPSDLVNAADHGVSNENGVPAVPSDIFAGDEAHKIKTSL